MVSSGQEPSRLSGPWVSTEDTRLTATIAQTTPVNQIAERGRKTVELAAADVVMPP